MLEMITATTAQNLEIVHELHCVVVRVPIYILCESNIE